MTATRFFPQMFVGMVSTGETTGNMDDILNKSAEFYEQEGMHATIKLVVILGVVVFLLVALMIAIKIIGMYTGIFNNSYGAAAGDASGE